MIVHIILNSHLDPVWLWTKDQGIDEVLATACTACGILDAYPEVVLTRGEAWFYETVERLDPCLFERIRRHVAAGRWRVVGNWYIQPDCNLASPESYVKHGEIGGAYFREKFGIRVKTGYNVDSFGHSAQLPMFYRGCGVENYVMMRPDRNEMSLPATDFIWRADDGSEVLTSRIIGAYLCDADTIGRRLEQVIAAADPRLGHVMCFCGVGDHGGGPTRAEIDWLLEHRHDYPGCEIRFSHPDAYFEAIRASGAEFPVVNGELQHHAVGSYSIEHRIKRELRSAENALIQSGGLLPEETRNHLWKNVLFATFHDVLAGSCIASAYPGIYDSLGEVRSVTADAVTDRIRRRNVQLPESPWQQLIFDNLSDREFNGITEAEPWLGSASLEYRKGKRFFLHDEAGSLVPFSILPEESLIPLGGCRIALALRIPPRGRRILKLIPEWEMDALPPEPEKMPKHPELSLRHTRSGKFSLSFRGSKFLDSFPKLQVLQDASDTWSHRMVRYAATPRRSFASPDGWKTLFSSSRAAAWISEWRDSEQNVIEALCRTDASRPGVSLEFRVNWHGGREMLKLSLKTAFPVTEHLDGCPGGTVRRPFDAKEYPFFNWLTLKGRRHSLTLVSPDIFAFDMQPDGQLRLTLLRANFYACDDKFPMPPGNPPVLTDQGNIRFRLLLLPNAGRDLIENEIHRFTDPVRYSETTRGIRRFVPGS